MKRAILAMTALATLAAAGIALGSTAHAAPGPKIKMPVNHGIKANIKIRPRLAPRRLQVRVNTDRLAPKRTRDANETAVVGPDATPRAQPRKAPAIAMWTPPVRLPQPRPEFDDMKDIFGADGLGEINPDEFGVGAEAFDPGGFLAGLGLPGYADEDNQPGGEFGETDGPTGPGGGTPGEFGDPWGKNEIGLGSDILNPVGGNSHGKDAPDAAPGVKVTPGSIAAWVGGTASTGNGPIRLPVYNPKARDSQITEDSGWTSNGDGTEGRVTIKHHGDGTVVIGSFTRPDTNSSEGVAPVAPEEVPVPQGSASNGGSGGVQIDTVEVSVAELHDPDYVDGGGYVPPNCGSYECNKARQRQANPGLAFKDAQNKVTKVYPGPDGGTGQGRNGSGDPIISQHDLLSQYDPDFSNDGSGPQVIDPDFGKSD